MKEKTDRSLQKGMIQMDGQGEVNYLEKMISGRWTSGPTLAEDPFAGEESPYIELTNDLLFHMVFTKNDKALKDLLSVLLGIPAAGIRRIEILNPMQYNDSIQTKRTILDLKVHLNQDSFILVEVQVRDFRFWTNRTLIYACRQIDEQTKGKEAYEKLQPVIQISIMKHPLFPNRRKFYTEYRIQDDEGQVLTDKMRFYVLDLSAVESADEADREQGLVQWAQAFNAQDWNAFKEIDRNGIREAANTMAMIMMNPTERQLLWDRKLALMDYNTEMISARMTGMEEGKINIARKMKSRGMSNDVIAQITELSEEEISKL